MNLYILWIRTIRWIHFIMWIHTIRWFTSLCEFIDCLNSYIIWIHTIGRIYFIMWIHIINEFTSLCEFIQSDEFTSLCEFIHHLNSLHHIRIHTSYEFMLCWHKFSLINLSGMPLVPREVLQVYQANWCVTWAFMRFDIV